MSRLNDSTSGQQGDDGQQAGSTVDQIKERASEVGHQIKDTANQLREKAGEQLDHLRDSAGEYYEQGRETAMRWEHSLEDAVRQNPVRSVLMAAGIGMVLGIIWRKL